MAKGVWETICERPSVTADGWDDLTVEVAIFNSVPISAEALAAAFPIGQQLGARKFFFQGAVGPIWRGGGIWTATLTYKGLAGSKPVVVDYGTSADEQSGENVATPDGPKARVSASENTPTANVRFATEDASALAAAMDEVGTNVTPPSAPAVAPSVWNFITDFTYHYPHGWVLVSRALTRLPGTNCGLVQDSYKYVREITP